MFSVQFMERGGKNGAMNFHTYVYVKHDSGLGSHIIHCCSEFLLHFGAHIAQALWRLILGNGLKTVNFGKVGGTELSVTAPVMLKCDSNDKIGKGDKVSCIQTYFCL